MVISTETGRVGYAAETFRVIELHSFLNGMISGTDSPIYEPRRIQIWLDAIQWK